MKMLTHYEQVFQNGPQQVIEANLVCGAKYSKTSKFTYDLRKITCRDCLERIISIASGIRDKIDG